MGIAEPGAANGCSERGLTREPGSPGAANGCASRSRGSACEETPGVLLTAASVGEVPPGKHAPSSLPGPVDPRALDPIVTPRTPELSTPTRSPGPRSVRVGPGVLLTAASVGEEPPGGEETPGVLLTAASIGEETPGKPAPSLLPGPVDARAPDPVATHRTPESSTTSLLPTSRRAAPGLAAAAPAPARWR